MLEQLERWVISTTNMFNDKLKQYAGIVAAKAEFCWQAVLEKLSLMLADGKKRAVQAGVAARCTTRECVKETEGKAVASAEKIAALVKTRAHRAKAQAKMQACIAAFKIKSRAEVLLSEVKAYAQSKAAVAKAYAQKCAAMAKACAQSAAAVAKGYAVSVIERVQNKYRMWKRMWRCNQHFTFWLIPADGQHIAKTHVKKSHLKYAVTGIAAFLVTVSVTIGVLAHFAIQNEAQKQELAEYKATKQAQEKTIQELQKMAENNQKQLAYLSKLEDKVRQEMEKNGAQLPPKSDISAYAGKGGPTLGDSSPMGYMLEQEKNIHNEANAKKADLENLISALENENYRREMTPSVWPTSGGYISSAFGGRANPFDGYSRDWHPGIDIAIDYGAPVYASAAGYVQQAGWYGGYGRYVRLSHDFGYVTAYGHMSSIEVSAGQYVQKGEIIGYVGSSGYSTGPHLHFEVIRYGEQINPSRLM
ncbi:MAG: M23 family metallopeptidase [Phascolarctobacterium sp.]|uniref:M23 family metallopeptidase n=1 Tax=Phascolarctobacterium sp. TaxID=2049039 RepID=UPI0026DD286F|nr:M23 family metallopeptidase [Phascolarctobacterium sp.]MDO4920395.1 M23 family metallopeptidase [Phascolarctobacterium sp.]